jgi:hypothetical protein
MWLCNFKRIIHFLYTCLAKEYKLLLFLLLIFFLLALRLNIFIFYFISIVLLNLLCVTYCLVLITFVSKKLSTAYDFFTLPFKQHKNASLMRDCYFYYEFKASINVACISIYALRNSRVLVLWMLCSSAGIQFQFYCIFSHMLP